MEAKLNIQPPLLNSANPWCTYLQQLQELYNCPYTGAVTTRTSLLHGFRHDESIHQFTFYNPSTHNAAPKNPIRSSPDESGSLNTLGYSPLPLKKYLGFIQTISDSIPEAPLPGLPELKPFIVSVTGTVNEVVDCYTLIYVLQKKVRMKLAMEVNLSCPNIPDKPPPAYDSATLLSYLLALKTTVASYHISNLGGPSDCRKNYVPIGLKTPPYTYHDQFQGMINALLASDRENKVLELDCPISFITATNTLGSSLLLTENPGVDSRSKLEDQFHHTINSAMGPGIGGLAGAPLHPLALGNVYTIRSLLDKHNQLRHIQVIGVGGVDDVDGFRRMRSVGADAVGVGTALGRKGVLVFKEIDDALKG